MQNTIIKLDSYKFKIYELCYELTMWFNTELSIFVNTDILCYYLHQLHQKKIGFDVSLIYNAQDFGT